MRTPRRTPTAATPTERAAPATRRAVAARPNRSQAVPATRAPRACRAATRPPRRRPARNEHEVPPSSHPSWRRTPPQSGLLTAPRVGFRYGGPRTTAMVGLIVDRDPCPTAVRGSGSLRSNRGDVRHIVSPSGAFRMVRADSLVLRPCSTCARSCTLVRKASRTESAVRTQKRRSAMVSGPRHAAGPHPPRRVAWRSESAALGPSEDQWNAEIDRPIFPNVSSRAAQPFSLAD